MKYSKCKCGTVGILEPVLECGMARWRVFCPECGITTDTWGEQENAIGQWNALNKNFPTCSTCEYYHDGYDPGLCIMHDRGTEETWTCPDYLGVTNVDKTKEELLQTYATANKTLLDTDFGESADELLNNLVMVDRREFYDLKEIKADYNRLVDDYRRTYKECKEATESSEYWYKQWKNASEENGRLLMFIGKIKEVIEG